MRTNILIIAGHDPSGGAGIHADIEAVHACGGHAATLITGLTIQNSQTVEGFELVNLPLLKKQADKLLEDMTFAAIKVGMTGSPEIVRWIAELKQEMAHVPLILDPVLAAESGGALADSDSVPAAIRQHLLPLSTLATPNLDEARILSGTDAIADAGHVLLDSGCEQVLITGTHDDTLEVRNHLFSAAGQTTTGWKRLPGQYHGSGCSLASVCATLVGQGMSVEQAVSQAQETVYRWLERGWQPGKGQFIPCRV